MRRTDSGLSFSATDLASYSACAQRTLLDRLEVLDLAKAEHYPDPRLDLIKERGMAHERAYLERLRGEGKQIIEFDDLPKQDRNPAGYRGRAEETLAAMRLGPDVIYQGAVYDERWLGFVDFLIKVDRPSALGPWSYEVADAKLTREAKAGAILQTCVYSEKIGALQGVEPERIHLYLGGPTPRLVAFRLAHFGAYYRALKARFLDHVDAATDEVPIAPDPVELCQICDWRPRCRRERQEMDHLSLVAGITRSHRRALEAGGVSTLTALARASDEDRPETIRPATYQRIREQARVQLTGREQGRPHHELRPLEAIPGGRPLGLAALPEPTPHDLFFDFEGADYAYDVGLEYLWGVSDVRDEYRGEWALGQDAEKACLDRFLTMATRLVEEHPGAHIYHYGHYEPTALKRLVGRYGIRTEELDALLQREAFVDLHTIVKQGVVASVESYSIKALEAHYGFEREVPMQEADPARGRLEYALAAGLRDAESLADAPVVEGYNRDDCVSTRALRDWLEGLRRELEVRTGSVIARPTPPEPREDAEIIAGEVRELMEALLEGVPEDRDARSEEQHIRWLTAHLLEWHRREDKSAWWDFFRLKDLSVDELVEETKPLAGLQFIKTVGKVKRSDLYRFRFPQQDHRLEAGDKGIDPHREIETKSGKKSNPRREIWAIDDLGGTVDLKVGQTADFDPSALQALLPDEVVGTEEQRARLLDTAQRLIDGEEALTKWSPASLALLRRTPPRFTETRAAFPAIAPEAPLLVRASEAAVRLEPGVLPVQGPPGTGKTYSGARMIRTLLRAGRTVGVTGPSHKVITNLLDAVCQADEDDLATPIVGLQATPETACMDSRFTHIKSSGDVAKAEKKREKDGLPPFNMIAGTAWLWSRDDMHGKVDVLFIDEAGQFSLANAVAVAAAAPRLVLLGDPQQLNQPQKGIHPPGTEVSVLEHLAGEDGILGPEQGLFLGVTWRMRPEITSFTSELFYESQLRSREDLSGQGLTLHDGSHMRGLALVEVEHQGNTRESPEEAEAVVGLYRRLLAGSPTFTDRKGQTRPLGPTDLLVVAPYNAQVSRIREALGEAGFTDARVGTVDKFQGQEAPVAIYSLASSSADDAPRGMEFLYALDRLNVATSRARVATIVVASPTLLTAECKRPEQMRVVNALVRYAEMAVEPGA